MLLVLGREPLVSAAELFTVLEPNSGFLDGPFMVYSGAQTPQALLKRLGGVVKVARVVAINVPGEELASQISALLAGSTERPDFGLSCYDEKKLDLKKLSFEIKGELKKLTKSPRVVLGDGPILSSVVVHTQKLLERGGEFIIRTSGNSYAIARTEAVQPFEEWSERDYGRPGRDDLSGMLPPKLARMMINMSGATGTLLDPFCGSGTILTEALHVGFSDLIGCDISDKAVADTKANVAWAQGKAKIFQADVRDISKKISSQSIDVIVAEPYMGPPLTTAKSGPPVADTLKELTDLYIGAFAAFKTILKPTATVVFILPRFVLGTKTHRTAEVVVPKIKKMGFSPVALVPKNLSPDPFVLYRRPNQIVGREIWKFQLTA